MSSPGRGFAIGAVGLVGLVAVSCGGQSAVRPSSVLPVTANTPPPLPPPAKNPPPTIVSLTAQGSRPRQPARFADLGEEIAVTAVVEDSETAPDTLTYEWSTTSSGVIVGGGRSIAWRAPAAGSTPFTAAITLAVVERFTTVDAGVPVESENRVSREIVVRVHDSAKELQDRAKRFLDQFSQSRVSPDEVMRDFQDGCGAGGTGKRDEQLDVERNRLNFLILDWFVGTPRVTIDFGGVSPFRTRQADGYAAVDVNWRSRCLTTDNSRGCPAVGFVKNDVGTDWVTAHYDEQTDRWWLCDSDYEAR